MITILRTEFFRLKKSKLFWALLIVTAVVPLISALISLGVNYLAADFVLPDDYEIDSLWELIRSSDMFGQGMSSMTGIMGDCALFSVITTSIFLSKEFSGGTFRNMLLANKSRRDLYLSYLTIAIVIGAIFLGTEFVSTFIFWSAIFGFGGLSAGTVISACFVTLLMGLVSTIFVQTLMCMFMFCTRKMAVAIICPIVIAMIAPSFVISFVETFAMLGLATEADLSWVPLYNSTILSVTNIDGALVGKILMYNIPLSVFFGFMGWVTFRKADLK